LFDPPIPPAQFNSAYLLVAHGSPDPRPQAVVAQLANSVAQKLYHLQLGQGRHGSLDCSQIYSDQVAVTQSTVTSLESISQPLVASAYLECHPLALHEQIYQFGQRSLDRTTVRLQILPLFLSPGRHVMEDLPQEVAIAQQMLGQACQIELKPYLGTHANLSRLLATYMATQPVEVWILLAHGSRRLGGNTPTEQLAERLGAMPAFWSIPNNLEDRITELKNLGYRRIAILPYFLFYGEIIDTISQSVNHLSQRFPTLNLQLMSPLESILELADLLVDLTLVVNR
jgi:sirohydrochlorin cobaltochelatase